MPASQPDLLDPPKTPEEFRSAAIKRLKAKSDFRNHLLIYLAVNALLTVIWATTNAGKPYPQGFFWPVFVMAGWGVAVVINAYVVFQKNPFTDERIEREIQRLQQTRR